MRFDLLSRIRRGFRAAVDDGTPGPADDYWYRDYSMMSAAGMPVSPERALRLASVYACVRVVSETVASLPLIIYKRLPNGGKERAIDHPLYKVLHDRPNLRQTSFEWLEQQQSNIELRGDSYNFKVAGKDGPFDQLVPINPDRVTVKLTDLGKLTYTVVKNDGTSQIYNQEQILHFRGHTYNGIHGVSTISAGLEVVGAGLAQQDYSATFWANDQKPGGVFKHPGKFSPEGYVRLKKSIEDAQSRANRHKTMILEEGADYAPVAITNKDSQFLETLQARRGEICSLFRVPPHKIGDLTRATFSNIEQQNIEFATDSIRPRLVRLEKRINLDLVDALDDGGNDEYFAEFLMDALLRGDLKSRYESYALAIINGWMSPNDARRNENMNPIPDGDVYCRQMNTVPLGTDPATTVDQGGQEDDTATARVPKNRPAAFSRVHLMIESAVDRVIRKEVKQLKMIAEKVNGKSPHEAVAAFYEKHAEFVAETLRISEQSAGLYAAANEQFFLLNNLAALISKIETDGAATLSALAGGELIQ